MNTKPILLWKHQKLTNAFTLRIGDIRYIGLIRTDKKGKSYWKFKEYKFLTSNGNSTDNFNSSNSFALAEEINKANEQPINQPESTHEN